jgi:NAD(P)-dependent dehydrogenase (short-subunit alcohol dehydrogenase family)
MKDGKVIITGASGAMGSVAARALAAQGHPVVMACRNLQKAEAVRSRIISELPDADIEIRRLELGSLESVKSFAEGLGDTPVSALFNNAGVISRGYSLTADGLENTFAVNYFGPVLLTKLLLSQMLSDATIVNMVSLTCRFVTVDGRSLRPGPDDFSRLGTYARSKLALLRFSQELARRNPGVRVNLADPGIVNSNMISMGKWFDPLADVLFRPFCKSPERGVQPALSALASEERNFYFVGKGSKPVPERYSDPELDLRLWEETERILSEAGA